MRESEKIFNTTFRKEIEPLLMEMSFSRYSLPKGWIQPSYLFKNTDKNIWYGCSWDWRDFYFEAELGGLFGFKDVLPRVIVCGFSLVHNEKPNYNSNNIAEQFMNVKNKLKALTENDFERYYIDIYNVQKERAQKLKGYLENEIVFGIMKTERSGT